MSQEEAKTYRLGIEGAVGAFTGKPVDVVIVDFCDPEASFADFYSENGELLKKMLFYNGKLYMHDGDAYYEAVTDNEKCVGPKSHESFVGKDNTYKLPNTNIVKQKDQYSKIFLDLFEEMRHSNGKNGLK